MKSFDLNIRFENFLEQSLYANKDQGRYEEDVGEVEGELAQGLVCAVGLNKVDMVARVYSSVGG